MILRLLAASSTLAKTGVATPELLSDTSTSGAREGALHLRASEAFEPPRPPPPSLPLLLLLRSELVKDTLDPLELFRLRRFVERETASSSPEDNCRTCLFIAYSVKCACCIMEVRQRCRALMD